MKKHSWREQTQTENLDFCSFSERCSDIVSNSELYYDLCVGYFSWIATKWSNIHFYAINVTRNGLAEKKIQVFLWLYLTIISSFCVSLTYVECECSFVSKTNYICLSLWFPEKFTMVSTFPTLDLVLGNNISKRYKNFVKLKFRPFRPKWKK